MNDFLFAIWFFLPAGIANMAPILANKVPYVNRFTYPIDGYKTYNGKRLLGKNKTIRGLLSGIILGSLVAVGQKWFAHHVIKLSFIPPSFLLVNPVLFGILSGLGALVADSIKSFFKRQANIPSGRTWFPFDQIDYVFGGILFTLPIYRLQLREYILVFLIYFSLHIFISYAGYLFRLKERPI